MRQNLLNNSKKQVDPILLLGCIAAVFRLGLFVRYPYAAFDYGPYDDEYFLKSAASILEGAWLGEYNYITLIKGVSFSLFVALANVLCMPYSMLLGLFYIASAAVFCHALRAVSENKWSRLLIFLYLIFSPIGFDVHVTQRLYRNAIIFPSVLLTLGSILLVYYRRDGKLRQQLPWLILSGVSFSFFYYIREDSIWLLPFFVCALMVTAVWYIWFSGRAKRELVRRCAFLLLPVAIFLGANNAYRGINQLHYGVDNINDRSGGAFATLTGNMIKVQDKTNAPGDFWITRDTLERITEECPSLTKHKEVFLSQYDLWAIQFPQNNGNVAGDLSVWAFREAMNRLGYYADAQTQEAFCNQINEELLTAVETGRLSFDEALHFTTQSRGIYPGEIPDLLVDSVVNAWDILRFDGAETLLQESTGPEPLLDFMDSITGVKTIRQSYEFTEIKGWIIVKEEALGALTVRLRDTSTGEYLTNAMHLSERADVAAAYPQEGNALYSGFGTKLDTCIDLRQAELAVFSGDQFLTAATLQSQETDQIILNYDILSAEVVEDANRAYSARMVAVGQWITQLYKWASPMLLLLALTGYLFQFVRFLTKRSWETFESVIILTGILLSAAIVAFGVTVFSGWLDAIASYTMWFYSCGAVPMGQAFVAMSLLYLARVKNGNLPSKEA